jgi:hypothetical protein
VALFWNCCTTVVGRHFTILTLVHRLSLNYKRGGWHRKQGWDKKSTQNASSKTNNAHHVHQPSIRGSQPHLETWDISPSLDISLYPLLQAPLGI